MKNMTLIGIAVWSQFWGASVFAKSRQAKQPLATLEEIQAPTDQDVCFSPEEPCDLELIKYVDGATKTLDIAIYDINIDELVHHILMKSKDVKVRIVVDQRQSKGDHSLVATLIKAGASVRYGKQRGIMHNKFIIRDSAMVETGSFNFTNHASTSNNENQVYLANPKIVERYVNRFESIWDRAKEVAH